MARMLGRRVWRGQTVGDAALSRKFWRVREKRVWRWEAGETLTIWLAEA